MKNILVLLFALTIFSCDSSKRSRAEKEVIPVPPEKAERPSSLDEPKTDGQVLAEGYKRAKVVDAAGLDGCGFLLELEDGSKLQPLNLSDAFRINNLEVIVKVKPENRSGICMAGKIVSIIDIRKR
jgi:hypothetical protein